MPTLRITQHAEGQDKQRVHIALLDGELVLGSADSSFDFELTAQDREDLRWYLGDYLQFPQDPVPTIAARVERRIAEIGTELFKALFQSSEDARDLWATLLDRLNDTRVEIATEVQEATAFPWELVRDPKTDTPLALRAQAFVRAHHQAAQRPKLPEAPTEDSGPIRILLVICRPGGREDVPFRSVASRLIKGLSEEARAAFQLDVLRPPTFEQLGRVLREAKAEDRAYHVIHFDGHGLVLDLAKQFERWKDEAYQELMKLLDSHVGSNRDRFGPEELYPRPVRQGGHGYLAFENPKSGHNLRLVDGSELGRLLVETDVPLLVLNACRSAHIEAPAGPTASESADENVHDQVRAIGSLAQEVMDTGALGVVAMRCNVYVVTAAQLVADLYAALTQGHSLGRGGDPGPQAAGRRSDAGDRLRSAPAAGLAGAGRVRGGPGSDLPEASQRRGADDHAERGAGCAHRGWTRPRVAEASRRGLLRPGRDAAGAGPGV